MQRIPARILFPGLFLLALVVRLPTLALPLAEESAVLASVSARLAQDGGGALEGHAPFLPLAASLLVRAGVAATPALRWVEALLAALLGPLLWLLLRRFGVGPGAAFAGGCLYALHPLALRAAGGVLPGGETAAAVLLLSSLLLLSAQRPAGRRVGALLALLLTTADPGALFFVPGLLWVHARSEPGPRWQTASLLLGALSLLVAPFLWLDMGAGRAVGFGDACLWGLLASLVVLLPALPPGVSALWAKGAAARGWLSGAALSLLGLLFGAPILSLALLGLVIGAGVVGAPLVYARFTRRVAVGALGGAALVSGWFVLGGLQNAVAPGGAAGAGRLHLLGQAFRSAAETAGEDGWIVLAVAEDSPADQASLADLAPDHWTWARRAPDAPDSSLRRLPVFPAAALEAGRSVAVVAEAGRAGDIETFGGAAIYEQELVRQIGPYVVLRARRP